MLILSGMATVQRERAFEQGDFRQPDMAPAPGRRKVMSNPMPFDASKRKASDSPTPAPALKKPRATTADAYLRVLRDFNRELEELHEISAREAQDVLEKAHVEGYTQVVRRTISTCILSEFRIDTAKTKYIHNMPSPRYVNIIHKSHHSN